MPKASGEGWEKSASTEAATLLVEDCARRFRTSWRRSGASWPPATTRSPATTRCRRLVQVPHEAECGKHAQHEVRHVDLPPEEALARGALVVVVVVVPSLAQRDGREDCAVSAVVGGRVAARSEHVRERVDREGAVPEQHGRHADPHTRANGPPTRKRRHAERGRRDPPPAVEPHELRVPRQVLDARLIGLRVLARQDPADVAPEETPRAGPSARRPAGPRTCDACGDAPPTRARPSASWSSRGRRGQLEGAARLETPVREVAVVAGRHEEHAHVVEGDGQWRARPRPAEHTTPTMAATCTAKKGIDFSQAMLRPSAEESCMGRRLASRACRRGHRRATSRSGCGSGDRFEDPTRATASSPSAMGDNQWTRR